MLENAPIGPKPDCGPDDQGDAEDALIPALGGPPVPVLRKEANGELLSWNLGSSFSCSSSCKSVLRRDSTGGGVSLFMSLRIVLLSIGERGPLPANESLVSRRLVPGREVPEVLTIDNEVLRAPGADA